MFQCNGRGIGRVCAAAAGLVVWLCLPMTGESTVVYDNTTNVDGSTVGGSPPRELGDQVTLGPGSREVTSFLFGYITNSDQISATVRFYANNGAGGAPGTVLFDSGPMVLAPGLLDKTLSGLSVIVPDTFTWTVAYTGPGGSGFGLLVYDPPTIGSSGDFFWSRIGAGWIQEDFATFNDNFKARVTVVPEPVSAMLLTLGAAGIAARMRRTRHGI